MVEAPLKAKQAAPCQCRVVEMMMIFLAQDRYGWTIVVEQVKAVSVAPTKKKRKKNFFLNKLHFKKWSKPFKASVTQQIATTDNVHYIGRIASSVSASIEPYLGFNRYQRVYELHIKGKVVALVSASSAAVLLNHTVSWLPFGQP